MRVTHWPAAVVDKSRFATCVVRVCSMKAVMDEMTASDIRQVMSEDELSGRTFMLDSHCHDMLLFPGDLLDMLEQHWLIEQCHLVLQVPDESHNSSRGLM